MIICCGVMSNFRENVRRVSVNIIFKASLKDQRKAMMVLRYMKNKGNLVRFFHGVFVSRCGDLRENCNKAIVELNTPLPEVI